MKPVFQTRCQWATAIAAAMLSTASTTVAAAQPAAGRTAPKFTAPALKAPATPRQRPATQPVTRAQSFQSRPRQLAPVPSQPTRQPWTVQKPLPLTQPLRVPHSAPKQSTPTTAPKQQATASTPPGPRPRPRLIDPIVNIPVQPRLRPPTGTAPSSGTGPSTTKPNAGIVTPVTGGTTHRPPATLPRLPVVLPIPIFGGSTPYTGLTRPATKTTPVSTDPFTTPITEQPETLPPVPVTPAVNVAPAPEQLPAIAARPLPARLPSSGLNGGQVMAMQRKWQPHTECLQFGGSPDNNNNGIPDYVYSEARKMFGENPAEVDADADGHVDIIGLDADGNGRSDIEEFLEARDAMPQFHFLANRFLHIQFSHLLVLPKREYDQN